MSNIPLKIGIVGNGAIGNLLAFSCHQNKANYQLLTRSGEPLIITCTDFSGTVHTLVPTVQSIEKATDADLLLLPLKAYQIEAALRQLKQHLTASQTIVLMNNGMGTAEIATALLPDNPIAVATTSYGAFKAEASLCKLTGKGATQAGWIASHSRHTALAIQQALEVLLPPCDWQADVNRVLWLKLSVNAVINPLSAIYQVTNGELLQPRYQQQVHQLCTEIAAVMSAVGIEQSRDDVVERAHKVMRETRDNYSSMNRDMHHERRTEIDFINGFVVRTAQTHNVSVPCNKQLIAQVKAAKAEIK